MFVLSVLCRCSGECAKGISYARFIAYCCVSITEGYYASPCSAGGNYHFVMLSVQPFWPCVSDVIFSSIWFGGGVEILATISSFSANFLAVKVGAVCSGNCVVICYRDAGLIAFCAPP